MKAPRSSGARLTHFVARRREEIVLIKDSINTTLHKIVVRKCHLPITIPSTSIPILRRQFLVTSEGCVSLLPPLTRCASSPNNCLPQHTSNTEQLCRGTRSQQTEARKLACTWPVYWQLAVLPRTPHCRRDNSAYLRARPVSRLYTFLGSNQR